MVDHHQRKLTREKTTTTEVHHLTIIDEARGLIGQDLRQITNEEKRQMLTKLIAPQGSNIESTLTSNSLSSKGTLVN